MMKKILFILPLILAFIACEPSADEFNTTITTSISSAEMLVREHDATVLWALENNQLDTIVPVTKNTLGQIVRELEKIQLISVPKDGESLKSAAEGYIESLVNFVKTQSTYADYTSDMSIEDARMMDKANSDALTKVESSQNKYEEFQTAFAKNKGVN